MSLAKTEKKSLEVNYIYLLLNKLQREKKNETIKL